jgi:disulfide bond formation protein DsbB
MVLLFKKQTHRSLLFLAIFGFVVAAYQTMTQFQLKAVPLLECVAIPGADCAKINMLEFGYITIPVMSLTFFAYVIVLGVGRTKNLNNRDKKTNI